MSFVVLLIFLVVLFFIFRFAFKLLGHLFTVLGWIFSDIAKLFSRVLDVGEPPPEEDEEETMFPPRVPRRTARVDTDNLPAEPEHASVAKKKAVVVDDAPDWSEPTPDGDELSILELIFYGLVYLFILTVRIAVGASDTAARVPRAFRAGFPVRCTIWYTELFLLVMPLVIIFRVPDVYGYGPVIDAVKWSAIVFAAYLSLIYSLRVLIPVDLETLLQTGEETGGGPARGGTRLRSILSGTLILAVSAVAVVKLIWLGVFLLGFFYSLLYFFAFRRRGNRSFTFRRFLASWLIFGVFTGAAVIVAVSTEFTQSVAGLAVTIAILFSFLFVYTLWVMSRKFDLEAGMRRLPVGAVAGRLNLFISPFLKLAYAAAVFYFIILFFSVNTVWFAVAAVAAVVLFSIRSAAAGFIPRYVPGGIFAGYMLLVWIAIFFVQSYNRIPPSWDTCRAVNKTEYVRPVWTMADFRRQGFLDGALPYDALFDAGTDTVFATFKNFISYGAIVAVDAGSGRLKSHLVTENDRFPGSLFYPERLCADKKRRQLYSTTKSGRNFQLLDIAYSTDSLKLRDRIAFPDVETTNCEYVPRLDTLYVIFLGPPDSHIRVLDGTTHSERAALHFGRFGYADYFAVDRARDRIIIPSLDPFNRFSIYEVKGIAQKTHNSVEHEITMNVPIPGGKTFQVPVPTLGVALDRRRNRIYFTSPFIKTLIEVDGASFDVTRQMTVGQFPREVAYHEKSGRLIVANYGSGTISVIDVDKWQIIATIYLGKLVRSIYIDPQTGRTFVVTACGIFEIVPDSIQ